MEISALLQDLRNREWYKGQILKTIEEPGTMPNAMSLDIFKEKNKHLANTSMTRLMETLSLDYIPLNLMSGLERAFPPDGQFGDSILASRKSAYRELLWQIVCLSEALDRGRMSIVLCSNARRNQYCAKLLRETISYADIEYAIEVNCIEGIDNLLQMETSMPMILVMEPVQLQKLLSSGIQGLIKERILSSLGRVAIPCLEEWPPALTTHTAYLLRRLHVECGIRGVFPSLVATASPALAFEDFIKELWGKSIAGNSIIAKADSTGSVPLHFINYSGAMLRDLDAQNRWIRESPEDTAVNLLNWLARSDETLPKETEVHYLVDVSGSMGDSLDSVTKFVLNDLSKLLENKSDGHLVKLTTFDKNASQAYPSNGANGKIGEDFSLEDFQGILQSLNAYGGTDIAVALVSAMKSAMSSEAKYIDLVLLSDGLSNITPQQSMELLELRHRIVSSGRTLKLTYIMLDATPPPAIRNLIISLGGVILTKSSEELRRSVRANEARPSEIILFLSGEKGLPNRILQNVGGVRRVVFTRDVGNLMDSSNRDSLIAPQNVVAVVVSGRFSSIEQIKEQIAHLGKDTLPVFILSETEAWGQMVTEDFPESKSLPLSMLIHTENPYVREAQLKRIIANSEIDSRIYRYLYYGRDEYKQLLYALGVESAENQPDRGIPLPDGFTALNRDGVEYVGLSEPYDENSPLPNLTTFSQNFIATHGEFEMLKDAATAPLLLGNIIDCGEGSTWVTEVSGGRIEIRDRSFDKHALLADSISIAEEGNETASVGKKIGMLKQKPVRVKYHVIGFRTYPKGNLDDDFNDVEKGPYDVDFKSTAIQWLPKGECSGKALIGLANSLRLTLVSIVKYADQNVLVLPDLDAKCIWIADLAPGGNGVSSMLMNEGFDVFSELLRLGGRVLLDCPCETGFASATRKTEAPASNDTGCPRCMRVLGTVLLKDGKNLYDTGSKQETLNWLNSQGYLPPTASDHINEKYSQGITESSRIVGRDAGSRYGCLSLVRKVFADRLGLEIDAQDIARFDWLPPTETRYLGVYYPNENKLTLKRGMHEWESLDVLAHELFHNYQHRTGIFNYAILAAEGIPYDGKLFIEGTAQWAACQVADALAIRSSLTRANIWVDKGNEYMDGFQVIKFLEENFDGISTVIAFMLSGDIADVTKGRIRSLPELYAECGLNF